jgi:hypothetical protein
VRKITTMLVATAVTGVLFAGALVSSLEIARAGARHSKPVTIIGTTGGTFTSASGDPSAKSSSGAPAPSKGDQFGVVIHLSVPGGLPESNQGVTGGENEKAECDGTFQQPTAPPGFLCVYLDFDHLVNVYEGKDATGTVVAGEGNAAAQTDPIGNGRWGALLSWNAGQPGPSTLTATWAYTKPR